MSKRKLPSDEVTVRSPVYGEIKWAGKREHAGPWIASGHRISRLVKKQASPLLSLDQQIVDARAGLDRLIQKRKYVEECDRVYSEAKTKAYEAEDVKLSPRSEQDLASWSRTLAKSYFACDESHPVDSSIKCSRICQHDGGHTSEFVDGVRYSWVDGMSFMLSSKLSTDPKDEAIVDSLLAKRAEGLRERHMKAGYPVHSDAASRRCKKCDMRREDCDCLKPGDL